MNTRNRSIIGTVIGIVVIIAIVIIFFAKRSKDNKGEKVYLDSTIYKTEYTLKFVTQSEVIENKTYYCVYLEITNTLTETQTFNISNPFFKTDKGSKVTFAKLQNNGFSIAAGETDYYMLACPYSHINEVKKCLLHFKLNKYYFNLHTCLESYENNK